MSEQDQLTLPVDESWEIIPKYLCRQCCEPARRHPTIGEVWGCLPCGFTTASIAVSFIPEVDKLAHDLVEHSPEPLEWMGTDVNTHMTPWEVIGYYVHMARSLFTFNRLAQYDNLEITKALRAVVQRKFRAGWMDAHGVKPNDQDEEVEKLRSQEQGPEPAPGIEMGGD